jgi:membrane fusion protein, multidrug efflux system
MADPESSSPAPSSNPPAAPDHAAAKPASKLLSYGTPILVVLLAVAIVVTITYSWNSWDGGRAEQVTDDASVSGDVTPLSTKIPGIVRDVKVSDYQQVHKGDLLVQLDDDDYQAQVAQATAGVAAAKASLENNRRQRALQDTKIESALASIDQAKAAIAAAIAGKAAVQADIVRTRAERTRQEALLQVHATTQQQVESAVANEERFTAQAAGEDAALDEAKSALHSSELGVEAERRGKDVLESQESLLAADLRAKEAALTLAQVDLGYTRIAAPADGSVGERQVHPGQLVSPGTQVIAFIDATRWVQANYRETQLTRMKPGDAAEVRVDAYPGQVFRGTVTEIAPASGSQFALLPPDNATGNYTKVVQRIPVKITLDASSFAERLRPGLSVIATVRTKD